MTLAATGAHVQVCIRGTSKRLQTPKPHSNPPSNPLTISVPHFLSLTRTRYHPINHSNKPISPETPRSHPYTHTYSRRHTSRSSRSGARSIAAAAVVAFNSAWIRRESSNKDREKPQQQPAAALLPTPPRRVNAPPVVLSSLPYFPRARIEEQERARER